MNTRKCGICKEEKEVNHENFHKDKSRYLGFMYNCKTCEKKRSLSKYEKNPRIGRYSKLSPEEKKKKYEIERIYSKTDNGRIRFMISSYKKFDSERGLRFDLTYDFFINNIYKKPCVYCGYSEWVGCDRIRNDMGHIMSNVVPCCLLCNKTRMDSFSHSEMFLIGSVISEIRKNRSNV